MPDAGSDSRDEKTATRRSTRPAEVESPFTVLIDTREQRPFDFLHLKADARQRRRPLRVPTQRCTLQSGDYSLDGCAADVAIERKSLADLYHTIGQERERFERELRRLASPPYRYAAVVVEAGWGEILAGYGRSKLPPKVVHRSVMAWSQRFPQVHWWMMDGRDLAEVTTYRLLERFWLDRYRPSPEVHLRTDVRG